MDNGIPNSKKILKVLGKRIKGLRQEKGWSQEAMAELAAMDDCHLGEIERGEVDLSLGTLARIAKTFEMTVSELFEGVA
ncbi:MAG TPA: helix-turn-helix transcriptional regulator [Candidatus Angelobacter sp.]|jgi:transcriptional regulator with XRE-family HTH domain|nr:helix-turn-helix transcriptional regulator [Candidatus Angelobacter sp.]